MGNYDAITAQRSQPLTTTLGTQDAINHQRYQALLNAGTLARQAYESVEAYNERMQKHREELAKRVEAENTEIVERRLKNVALFNSNATNPYQLKGSIDELQYALRFAQNNRVSSSLDHGIYLAKQQKAIMDAQMAQIKQGKTPEDDSSKPLNYCNFEFQDVGSRDMLA